MFSFHIIQFSKIAGEVTLSTGQTKPLISQEECWEFIADNMAPFTSSKSVPFNNASCSGGIMLEEQAKDVIASFFGSLQSISVV